MTKSLPLVWIQGMENPKAFESTIRNSTLVLGRLKEILEDYISTIDSEELSDSFYLEDNLTERLVLNRGQKKALTKVLTLLSFMEN